MPLQQCLAARACTRGTRPQEDGGGKSGREAIGQEIKGRLRRLAYRLLQEAAAVGEELPPFRGGCLHCCSAATGHFRSWPCSTALLESCLCSMLGFGAISFPIQHHLNSSQKRPLEK